MILLGKTLTVVRSTNPALVGAQGVVVEDSRDGLRIRTPSGAEKLLVKHTVTIMTEGFIIEGKDLVGTHASRSKR